MATSKSKSAPSRPYRRSIWRHDPRYDVDPSALSASEIATICRLSSVDAAKKQVPAIPPNGLLAIAKAARALPAVGRVSANQICKFLESTVSIHGAGIPTVVCMLAVESDGAYPPMDRRVVAGLRKLGRISQGRRGQARVRRARRVCGSLCEEGDSGVDQGAEKPECRGRRSWLGFGRFAGRLKPRFVGLAGVGKEIRSSDGRDRWSLARSMIAPLIVVRGKKCRDRELLDAARSD